MLLPYCMDCPDRWDCDRSACELLGVDIIECDDCANLNTFDDTCAEWSATGACEVVTL